MSEFKFNLGQKVKDSYTGFNGRVMSRTDYLTGCNRYGVQAEGLDKDGKPYEWEWFDEMLLEKVDDVSMPSGNTGGVAPIPRRTPDTPRR